MMHYPEWDIAARCSLIPTHTADVSGLAGTTDARDYAVAPGGRVQRNSRVSVVTVELGEAVGFARRYGCVCGWFGRLPEAYSHQNNAGSIEGLIVVSRPHDRIHDDGLTREVRLLRHVSADLARALLCGTMHRCRRAGVTRLLVGPSVLAGADLDALGFVHGRFSRHDDLVWMRVLRFGESFRVR